MALLFYDHLLELDKIDKRIKKITKTHDEKLELWAIVDEIIHHRVFGCILEKLPQEAHTEFLDKFHQAPHDKKLLKYLKTKIKDDVSILIQESVTIGVLEVLDILEEGHKLPKKIKTAKNK